MEIKHQVFVSSTYKDLIDERKEVIHALLELDCIPAGMELFPATDEDAWSLIKDVIDNCDYYILIMGGKYGSTNSDGISFTEMEYNYAVEVNKPIISFIHEILDDLPASKMERAELAQQKLNSFREKVQIKHCKFWSSATDLGGKVSRSLVQLRKRHPSDGWVPGRYAADAKMLREFQTMRARVTELEAEKLTERDTAPHDSENYQQGNDTYSLGVSLTKEKGENRKRISLSATWDKIFSYCGPTLANECEDKEFEEKIKLAYWHSVPSEYVNLNSNTDMILTIVDRDQIKIQLQALGLISPGTKKRAVSDTKTYWKMTPYGEKYLIKINALKREDNE